MAAMPSTQYSLVTGSFAVGIEPTAVWQFGIDFILNVLFFLISCMDHF
jgi:hypothetical protein